MITEESVREVIETARIEDVVGDFVSLRRRGQNMLGLCPFHNEKTPSFNVNPARNIFKCFGCGQAGDPVKFLMELEQLSFPDAIKWLAARYNIKLKEKELSSEEQVVFQEKESLYLVNEFARNWFEEQLLQSDEGKSVGLPYFISRGFREETIRKFGLGFAPNVRDAFTQKALAAGYKKEQLEKLGLSRNGRDFFYDRVMFTIHNLAGKPIAFAGRILKKDVKAPKYVNSPETEIYHKSSVLYGMYQAKQAIRKLDNVYLVEGYTDVISLHQNGIENVVASSGTSLTPGQVSLISRFTQNVCLLYDGDKAGIKAALRGVDILLDQDINVRCVLLPEGEDPDSYLQSVGTTAFEDYLSGQSRDFMLFKADLLLEDASKDPSGKTAVIQQISESLARIKEPLRRAEYIKQLAERLDVQENLLISQINKAVSNRAKELHKEQQRTAFREQRQARQTPPPQDKNTETAAPPINEEDADNWAGLQEPAWIDHDEAALPPEDFHYHNPTSPATIAPPQEEELAIGHTYQERYLAQLLILHGDKIYDTQSNSSVTDFLLANVMDVINDFDNAFYQEIVLAVRDYVNTHGEAPKTGFFLHHPSPKIKEMAMAVSISPYSLSPHWEDRYANYLTQKLPEDNYQQDSESFARIFRLAKIDRMLKKNEKTIRTLQNTDPNGSDIITYVMLHQKLTQLRKEVLGTMGVGVRPPKFY